MLSTIPPVAGTDWTALHNFAALRGQFRVSITPRCNVACWFCHNEADVPPPLTRRDRTRQPRTGHYGADEFLTVINAAIGAGLKRVFFTGGEPLTSHLARDVLTGLRPSGPDGSYTLITNGTRVRIHQAWLSKVPLDTVKVSLHYFSDESFKAIAGTRIGIDCVLDGVEAAREIFDNVELNCLLQKENAHEIRDILAFALDRRMPVQFIELVGTDFNEDRAASAVPADDIIRHLRTLTSDERTEIAGVGQGRRIFRVDGVEIDVIHRNLGRHHVGQCGTCPVRPKCVEGFWALRADHAGGLQPCLLRDDLRLDIKHLLDDPARLAEALAGHVTAFTEGVL
ncbi:radical SAM protein [Streptomyces sp. NBC_01244]|uniref:radical SAM protein n=1 Tax=Streptomyces sp. NBC_01244 TaxID=2903797 RepID=UPI002E11090C|nr:radical SAM protein [Streptomyces sp. NBC_01244]